MWSLEMATTMFFSPCLRGAHTTASSATSFFGAGGVDRDRKLRFALLFGADGKAVLSGETDEILHGGVVIDEHLHGLRRSERVDRLLRLYDRHRAGFAKSVYGNHIKDLLIGIFYEENTTFFAADLLEI